MSASEKLTALESPPGTLDSSGAAGYLAVLLAAALWGTSGIFIKFIVASSGVSALALAFWRDLFAFTVLLISLSLLRPSWLRVHRRDLGWLAAVGGSIGLLHVCWNLGVLLNGAAVTTVQQAAVPAIVAVAAWLIWREPLTWNKILAVILIFAGTVLVSDLDILGQVKPSLKGLLVGLGVPFSYAAWNLLGKKVRENYSPLTTLTYAFGFGALVLLPFQFFTPQPWPVPLSSWLWFAGWIGVATITGFSIYTFALGRLPASVATILAMTEILFVSIYAYFLLGERLTATQIVGAALVIGGVLLLSWGRWRRAAG